MYEFVVWNLLQPFPVLCLATALMLANLWRKRKESRRRLLLVTIPFALLVVSCLPPAAWLARYSLEAPYPPLHDPPTNAQAIVVLSSYVAPPSEPGGRPELDQESLSRCHRAADLARRDPSCPILVSGGTPNGAPGPECAVAMRDYLVQLGLDATRITMENRSRTTHENAVQCNQLLRERNIKRIILVTSADHLLRAVACFRKEGLDVTPCGCRYQTFDGEHWTEQIVPSLHAGLACEQACHEWLGTAWYWMRGRI
jgi:uncharacterized SAM-binding protein YcdF (DUF218 family)